MVEDLVLFNDTQSFTSEVGVLVQSAGTKVPPSLRHWVGAACKSANTLGDGACALHAAFGSVNKFGQLDFGADL